MSRPRLRKCFLKVLALKRLRWLQSTIRCSLNSQKLRNDPELRQKFTQLLSLLTMEISGTASWFDHVKRVEGTLWFTKDLSEKGNVTRSTRLADRAYRRERLGLHNV